VRQERPYGSFSREVTLPVLVDADKVQASYENGVLRLVLPKSEAAKPRKITVQA
jgi:HSP20 family protein